MSERHVVLRSGLVAPLDAYLLALDLERRGVRLAVDGSDVLVEGNVSDDDISALRTWKPHVLMLLQHVADDTHLHTTSDNQVLSERRSA